jgi:hypothetical protein
MATQLAVATDQDRPQQLSIVQKVANRYGMAAARFVRALYETCVPANATESQVAAFLSVADEYGLNPLTKEIFAFESKGRVVPMISIDGWVSLVNRHPQMDGMEFVDIPDATGKLLAIECTLYRKDRSKPIKVIEYLSECKKDTMPWKTTTARMLRHRALIQCARYAFGFSGVASEDEAEALMTGQVQPMRDATPPRRVEGTIVDDARPIYAADADSGRVDAEPHDAITGEIAAESNAEPDQAKASAKEKKPASEPTTTVDDEMESIADKIEAQVASATIPLRVVETRDGLRDFDLTDEARAYLVGKCNARIAELRAKKA